MKKQRTQNYLLLIFIFLAVVILGGISLGVFYSSLPQHHPQDSQKNCESVNGRWLNEQCVFEEM
ncbi:hypothetical protein KKE14_03150 [Patescibacteria group bacterium]|nr:hypothetical protein [Patescibacteria group bacterium]